MKLDSLCMNMTNPYSGYEKLITFAKEVAGVKLVEVPSDSELLRNPDTITWDQTAIEKGVIYFARTSRKRGRYKTGAHIGNLTHEVGHLALIPTELREYYSGFGWTNAKPLVNYLNEFEKKYPDAPSPLVSDDLASSFWSYFALKELGLNPKWAFSTEGYIDAKEANEERVSLESHMRKGIPSKYSTRAYSCGLIESPEKYSIVRWTLFPLVAR